jgi:hypothetical protein
LPEEDKPLFNHILQRDFEKERYEGLSPFFLHVQREGEPLYPRSARRGFEQRELDELDRELKRWTEWAGEQPDANLLLGENMTYLRLQRSQFKLPKDEAQELYQTWQKEAENLRKAGHGNIIDKYWPHLSKPLSSNR